MTSGADYRERALKLLPWICARNHDHNPVDGSNWELLCVYCHENEHAREVDSRAGGDAHDRQALPEATHKPFAGLADLLKPRNKR
jgi:hypothetical protein